MDFSEKGIYCLIFKNQDCKFEIGKKVEFSFPAGFYIYVGSALGPGGLKRVTRHINFSRNKDRSPRWHVDYLHLNPSFRLVSAVSALILQILNVHLPAGSEEIQFLALDVQTVHAVLIYFTGKKVLFRRLLKLFNLSNFRALCLNFELSNFFIFSFDTNRKA